MGSLKPGEVRLSTKFRVGKAAEVLEVATALVGCDKIAQFRHDSTSSKINRAGLRIK